MWTRASLALLLVVVTFAAVTSACGGSDSSDAARPATGEGIYRAYCARCHGKNGQGFVGPSLIGIADKYTNIDDQIAVVAIGKNLMPAWRGQLTPEEIRKVVEYTRAGLGANAQ
jgi:cytochrome c oxidase subunit II